MSDIFHQTHWQKLQMYGKNLHIHSLEHFLMVLPDLEYFYHFLPSSQKTLTNWTLLYKKYKDILIIMGKAHNYLQKRQITQTIS
jgi:hypothetical protein